MRNRLLSLRSALLLIVLLGTVQFISAYDFEVDGIYYNISSGNKVSVTSKPNGYYSGVINIPANVTHGNIEYTVNSIGESAFRNCTGLTTITIPNSATSIGKNAFQSCSGLMGITIPKSVTSIGKNAFQSCSGLMGITIPKSVTSIGKNAFQSCSGLTRITVESGNPKYDSRDNCNAIIVTQSNTLLTGCQYTIIPTNVTAIGNSAFDGCTGLTSVTIPSSVTTIGNNAFDGCTGLLSVTIGESVTAIGSQAFNDCTALKTIYFNAVNCGDFSNLSPFPSTVQEITFGNGMTRIPAYFAKGVMGLTSVTIPASVTTIGDVAFSGCTGLLSVTIGESVTAIGSQAFNGCTGLTSVTIPSSVTTIGNSAFDGCPGLLSVTIGESVTAIGSQAFNDCTALKTIYFNAVNCGDFTSGSPFSNSVQELTFGNGVSRIPAYVAKNFTGLTSITIPESVTSIGDYAFSGCTGLTSIDIQNTVIGNYMFQNCTGLTSVTIPNAVTTIGNYAFYGCAGLTSVTIPSSVTTIGNYAFYGCAGLTSVTIPSSTTTIGNYAFYGCTGLMNVNIPESVTFIGNSAFRGCGLKTIYFNAVNCSDFNDWSQSGGGYLSPFSPNVKEIFIGNSVTHIPACLAKDFTGLTSVTIPSSVTTIGNYAFYGCTGLTSITIPESVTSYGGYAFYGCTGLTGSITIPESVTSIGAGAFSGCTGVTTVYFNAVNCSDSYGSFPSNVEEIFIGNGVTRIPTGIAANCTGLRSITIPESVTSIGGNVFYNCTALTEVISLPLMPPSLSFYQGPPKPDMDEFDNGYSFYGAPSSMVIYVLPAALETYREDYLWGHRTILPLENYGVVNLTVGLTDDIDIAAFAGMRLEIHQRDSEKKMNCIIANHHSYTFGGINKNTSWDIMIANHYGDVFGGMENVFIDSADVNVTITSLLKPQTVTLMVKTPSGQDVTEQASIKWLDENGELLTQDKQIAGLPPGRSLSYSVNLPQELATAYSLPANMTYTVKDGANNVICQLSAIAQTQLSGKVKDATNNQPLYGATISATQTFAGGNTKTMTATTDNQGAYSLDASSVPTIITVAAQGYISQTLNCDDLMTGDNNITLPDVALNPITGAVINVNLTFTPAHAEDETSDTQNWYNDYNNVDYVIYDKTTGYAITDISVQYPQIVLMEDVNDGDVLELTATSRKDAFKPVKTTITIADQKATATFDIKEWGKVQATFNKNINPEVTGTLYDAENKLVKTADYMDNTLTINALPDGNYTLITMGKSDVFNSIYDLDQFAAAGLQAGTDYARSDVEVKNGIISKVAIHEVPFFDETKFYYTEAPTSFTVNKSKIVIGNYFIFGAQIDFKEQYADKVSDVRLIVDLPESCPVYENSVMVGNSVAYYTIQGNRLTIPLYDQIDNICFCATPTQICDFTSSAFVQFRLNGKTIVQPIGNLSCTVKGLSIYVPPLTATTSITISGTAVGVCDIDIFDNEVLIGQTKSLANGYWNTNCELFQPKNLSTHNIYAVAKTQDGLEFLTEKVSCIYDKNAIEVDNVEMVGPLGGRLAIFDFLNGQVSPNSYPYYVDAFGQSEFTFIVKFSNNDPSVVSNVTINVITENGGVERLNACYDSITDRWVASFGYYGRLPVNVSVSYYAKTERMPDAEFVNDNLSVSVISQMQDEMENAINDGTSLLDQLLELYVADDYDETRITELENEVCDYLGLTEITPIAFNSQEEGLNLIDEISEALSDPNFMVADNFIDFDIADLFNASDFGNGIEIQNCDNYDESSMLDNGFEQVLLTDSTSVYYKQTETEFIIISFTNNIAATIDLNALGLNAANRGSFMENAQAFIEDASEKLTKITDAMNSIKDFIDTFSNAVGFFYGRSKEIFSNAMGSLKWLTARRVAGEAFPAQAILEDGFKEQAMESGKTMLDTQRMGNSISRAMNSPIGRVAQRALAAFDIISQIAQAIDDVRTTVDIWNAVPDPCEEDQEEADAIRARTEFIGGGAIAFYTLNIASTIVGINGAVTSAATLAPTAGVSLTTLLVDLGIIIAKGVACNQYHSVFEDNANELQARIDRLKCKKEKDDDDVPAPPCPPVGIIRLHDPSGFVYEGVPSNRLQGVTATCYYKETGDQYEEVVLWDAENYGQQNPLYTDENGYYRWDVPIGMWQVKYEKAGYETTYSDWLPVPPPQLDVNIGMVQMRQPEVIKARAYPQAVELEFDKYMFPETLTTDNITVSVNGTAVSGTIELLNAEVDDPNAITTIRRAPGTGLTFASKVRFNADQPFNADHVTLRVKQNVKSYADMQMNEDYETILYLEYEMEKIVVDSTLVMPYGDSRQLTVTVLPAMASRGKTLTVSTMSPMILSTDAETYTLDNNGQAMVTVHGDLPGMASLLYGIDGYDLNAATIVKVMMESQMTVAAPTATIASGSEVPKGTAVYLRCSTPGATIYYTLDGSCPCDDTPARKVYDGSPIIINGTMTIKAMATVPELYDSDVATFIYRVGSGLRGDINGDGEINIADINAGIDIILGSSVSDDVLERADVNGDGEMNIADINALIDIILTLSNHVTIKVNCDDLLHMEDVTIKPGDVRTLSITLDNAIHYSALQCDIVLPAGLTLVATDATGANQGKCSSLDDFTSRALTYSMSKLPFVGGLQPVLTFTVQADAALALDAEITLTNIVLADADNKAWRTGDCTARVYNASGINDLTANADRVWVEGKTLCMETRQEGTAQLITVNGMVSDMPLKVGVNRRQLESGIYIVVIHGVSHKIAIE